MIQEDLAACEVSLREVCGAGEPLSPEVIERARQAWSLTIRDGYGQTEATAMIANPPGRPVVVGAMGRPLPGYAVRILDPDSVPATEGEVCLMPDARPAGLMQGYQDDDGALLGTGGGVCRTGDLAFADEDGTLTFVGRADDVFKSWGHRISPFELESVLIEHPAVAEAAIVPAPDAIRLAIPVAYLTLVASAQPSRETAASVFDTVDARRAPFKRIRRLAFLPKLLKTVSGKIRRVRLRRLDHGGAADDFLCVIAFDEVDLPRPAAPAGASGGEPPGISPPSPAALANGWISRSPARRYTVAATPARGIRRGTQCA